MKTNYCSRPFFFGIVFTLIIALISMVLVKLPVLSSIGALAVALIIGIIYRQSLGNPEYIRPGITFSAKKLIRFAIILYGFKLNLQLILSDGLIMLLLGALVIFLSFTLMHIMNKFMKDNDSIMYLLAADTRICRATAISVVNSITKCKKEDTTIAFSLISFVLTVRALIYSFLV